MGARLTGVLVALVVVVLGARSLFVVEQSGSALRTRFGRIVGNDYGPGLHVKSPLDQVHRFDRRLITSVYAGESFLTRDQQALSVDFDVKWRLADLRDYYQRTAGDEDLAAQRLADLVRGRLKSAVAQESLAEVTGSPRGGLGDAGFDAMRTAAHVLGVELVDLQLQRVDLTDESANVVYQRMEQGFNTQALQAGATGTIDADKIRSDADRKRADTLADATRQAAHIRADADARAAAIYAQAYGRNPELAAFTQSLQAYKSSIGREGDVLVITPEGDFFKYLLSPGGHPGANPGGTAGGRPGGRAGARTGGP
ncbi:MAG TPA: protease modulator HflC [Steroidobacteraceae bacterium]|jgi:membrane protease subunit HflC|nr:protease modulator HflC [Steroidobacteraceae bacterium]